MAKTLILGLGNDILSDDAIGPKIVYQLEKELEYREVIFKTSALGGLEIVEMIRDFDKVLIIDAIKTKDGVPGSVYRFTPEDFNETLHISSFHDVSFLTALELAKNVDLTIPSSIEIIAIEILEDLEFSNEFSPYISEKYDSIFKEVKQYVFSFLEDH